MVLVKKKTDYNAKTTDVEDKNPNVSNLTTVENKIPNVVIWLKKTDYSTKITEIENKLNNHNHDKYITTPEFNKLAADVFDARLKQGNLVKKRHILMLYFEILT